MIGENRRHLVADEPVEVQDCRKITDHFRGIHRTYPTLIKENRRMSACNRLDLQNTRISTDYAKNLPDHWSRFIAMVAGWWYCSVCHRWCCIISAEHSWWSCHRRPWRFHGNLGSSTLHCTLYKTNVSAKWGNIWGIGVHSIHKGEVLFSFSAYKSKRLLSILK